MATLLATSSPSSLVVLATAQPSWSSPRRSAKAARQNAMRPSSVAAASNSSAAVSAAAAAAPTTTKPHSASTPRPDAAGRFGAFGGKYVPETLIAALTELEEEYTKAQADPAFKVRRLMEREEQERRRRRTRGTIKRGTRKRPDPKPFFPLKISSKHRRPSSRPSSRTTSAAPPRSTSPSASRSTTAGRPRSGSSARTSTTRARTRSTTRWARCFSVCA